MAIFLIGLAWLIELSPSEKLVLLSLADRAGKDGHCWPSLLDIERRTGVSRRHIQRCLNELELAGHIKVLRRPGRSSVYVVHPRHNDTSEEKSPVAPSHSSRDSESGSPRLPDAQTDNNRKEAPRIPRPELTFEANTDLLVTIGEPDEAEQLRAYMEREGLSPADVPSRSFR